MSSDITKEQESEASTGVDFIRTIINNDLASGKHKSITTRFPPEPNGYLHIGHVKSICLNFGIKEEYQGKCNLRFDDTNPTKEEQEYVDSIKEDVRWLGFNWNNEFYASDYFETMYEYAIKLIKDGKAFVCELNADEVRQYRGTLTEPGKNSPFRDRPIEENLDLFARMRNGDFTDGKYTLRAKIDMSSPNINLRDPAIYRIRHAHHHRTGDKWCIYPMYDYAHCISDAIEGITHSLCTLEFEDHRPLYDWYLNQLQTPCHPQQIEFARLNITYTVMSKRKFLALVNEKKVSGWDDPRMPTIAGLRRRGYTPEALRYFCKKIGISKAISVVDLGLLEFCLRETFNSTSERRMAVLNPIKITLTNYPDNQTEEFEADNNPENLEMGKRKVPFSKHIYIESDDFMEVPAKKYFRLYPGNEVRLMHAYIIKCNEVIKDENGNIKELLCTYDPESKGGCAADGRKIKGTIHWVSATHAINAEVRLYDNLFNQIDPEDVPEGQNWTDFINPKSLEIVKNAYLEPSLKNAELSKRYQFLRLGYFCLDSKDSKSDKLVFNRTVGLKDSWAKIAAR
jgi:glutaminyl-tRNA synthetase